MKNLSQLYASPTPKKWRKIGDALLAVSTTITTYAIADEWNKYATLSALILGVIGKFLTNFFSED
jgi:hypothetical protein